jgi:hypothetical protein
MGWLADIAIAGSINHARLMSERRHFSQGLWQILRQVYVANAVAVAFTLTVFMIGFGVMTSSVAAGLTFPIALPSMALEGDFWGIWMLSPIYLSPILFCIRSVAE